MQLLPFKQITLDLHDTVQTLLDRLQPTVAPQNSLKSNSSTTKFSGQVIDHAFRLHPPSTILALYMPEIHGRFVPTETGTNVLIDIVPPRIVVIGVNLCIGTLLPYIFYNYSRHPIPETILVIIAGYVNCMFGFWLDNDRSLMLLTKILQRSPTAKEAAT